MEGGLICIFMLISYRTQYSISIFQQPERSRGWNCIITMPNFVEIASTVTEISRFFDIQDGGRRHLGFSKFEIFNVRNGQESRTASPCQFSSKSLELRPRYVSFNIMLVCLFTPLYGFWGTFSTNDVTHHPNPQKDHPWAKPRHLSHKPRIYYIFACRSYFMGLKHAP